jgi:phosphoribosylformylglycinamidine synthase
VADPHVAVAERIALRSATVDDLARVNTERGLALDPAELLAVQAHFVAEGRDPTDVELETLAQTWSEHCAHKTFRALLLLPDGSTLTPLLAQLRQATDDIAAPWVVSAFVGNAGILQYSPERTYAVKMETHNHPSAVEPFGGANTGVGGVIRDVLGAAHHPIAVTDVLCFGPPDLDPTRLQDGVLHPRRIRDGVIAGVADYGNKMGLPTVAGAVLYDDAYTANPLVFAGCIGVAAAAPPLPGPQPADHVVVIGGRTGRDGIRGATFSSMTMDATTGEVAGASVQIGDPIVEKRVMDALAGAHGLYTAITDCGAGGLSSAVGEMAEGVGARVELDRVPLKYAGLAAWEIWLSEAQERMVLAVPDASLAALTARCDRYGAEWCVIGTFTGDSRLVVTHDGDTVLDLDTAFLHDGRPRREMPVVPVTPDRRPLDHPPMPTGDPVDTLLSLLADRNVASKADVIHHYDHEIRGATVGRPLVGPALAGPGDGSALVDPGDHEGLAIGIGVNPWFGIDDPERMAWAVVDEAVRNLVAVGADPRRVALMDNFSWGDPRRPSTLGALVAAVQGCCDAARVYDAPFVSGKDSLNNEYLGADGERHAVPPTLVITAVAPVRADDVLASALVRPGNVLVLVGATRPERGLAHPGPVPAPDPGAPARYRALHQAIGRGLVAACHDVSDGGLAVAVAEMCIGGGLGARLDRTGHDHEWTGLFSESLGRLVCEVRPDHLAAFTALLGADEFTVLGEVIEAPELRLRHDAPVELAALSAAFSGAEV